MAGRSRDRHVALLVSAALFVVGAWPLALTEVPPYQDLPNHLAAITVIENPARYPEFVFNGFFKTNAALFAWLFVVGKVVGTKLAARLFALMVLGANAIVLPRFVLALTGSRKRMLIASLFMWPMVHNWFVSMGMLDFALSVPLSLGLLLAIDRQRRTPTLLNALARHRSRCGDLVRARLPAARRAHARPHRGGARAVVEGASVFASGRWRCRCCR